MKNFPDTIQLGSVTNVTAEKLPNIDLLIGGSPCQGFSFSGKQLNFNDPRSKLFFEYVRLLKECAPKYFLLENVVMKKEYEHIITDILGVDPIMINSALPHKRYRNVYIILYTSNLLRLIVQHFSIDNKRSYLPKPSGTLSRFACNERPRP